MVYKPAIPLPGDNLSTSQGDIKNNFGGANTSFGINHYPFDNLTLNNGKHKFVEMPVSATIPPGLAAGEATFYSKTAGGESNVFFTPDNSINEYQVTTAVTAQIATFGLETEYPAAASGNFGGWTFLPGGLVMQYGRVTKPAAGTYTVPFLFPFTSIFSFTTNNGSGTTPNLVNFSVSNNTRWMAIGKV